MEIKSLSARLGAEITGIDLSRDLDEALLTEILHPLVRAHPVNGKKALYGAADTGIGIVGMPRDEAMKLCADIGAHATRDRFVYRHQYQSDDIVIWDNAQLLHAAEILHRASSVRENRIMHRVSVRGWPAPGGW